MEWVSWLFQRSTVESTTTMMLLFGLLTSFCTFLAHHLRRQCLHRGKRGRQTGNEGDDTDHAEGKLVEKTRWFSEQENETTPLTIEMSDKEKGGEIVVGPVRKLRSEDPPLYQSLSRLRVASLSQQPYTRNASTTIR
jgi:hypothetical protein